MLKQKNSLISVLLWEMSGTSMVGISILLLGLKTSLLIAAPFIGIPTAIIVEFIGWLLFLPVRKISFFYNLNQELPKEEKFKNDNALFNINISRSFFIFSVILFFLSFYISKFSLWIMILSLLSSMVFLVNIFRFEYYFRKTLYERKMPVK